MKIKVCGNKYNIPQVAGLKPDMMGFVFYEKSPRWLLMEDVEPFMNEIMNIIKVGVFVNMHPDEVISFVHRLKLDIVQLHGDESPETCELLKRHTKVMKALDGNSEVLNQEIINYKNGVDYFLIDNKGKQRGGTGEKFSWKKLEGINFSHPFMLAGGIGPNDVENIAKIKSHESFHGIDLNSGFELSPGMKNTELLHKFINQVL